MAANFRIGDSVKVNKPAPQGPVLQIGVDQEGNITYLVEYTNEEGLQRRWFQETELIAAS